MSADQVANAFTQHYYQTFDSNPDALVGLFVSLLGIASLCFADNESRCGEPLFLSCLAIF